MIHGSVLHGGLVLASVVVIIVGALPGLAQAPEPVADRPYVVEYYYKAKWGHQREFWTLFEKNHLPILQEEVRQGRITRLELTTPRYHATEDGRWDYRVTITFRSLAAGHGEGAIGEEGIRKLYPDQAGFEREEQRRFEILEAHWDVPVTMSDLGGK
jgi:hypothetical protein